MCYCDLIFVVVLIFVLINVCTTLDMRNHACVVLCLVAYVNRSSMICNNIDSHKTPVKCNGTVKNGEMSSIAARTPNGLAELFAGGMPKLKPTGMAVTGTIIF